MNQELYYVTIDLQRYNRERMKWTTYLTDLYERNLVLYDRWTTSEDNAGMYDYADAVELQLKIREHYPHAIVNIIAAE